MQSEAFRKRLAERQKSKNNRSLSLSHNQSLSLNFGLSRFKNAKESLNQEENTDGTASARRQIGESKIGQLTKMNSSLFMGGGGGGFSGNDSFYSYGGKSGGAGGGLASKISMALSRVVQSRSNA